MNIILLGFVLADVAAFWALTLAARPASHRDTTGTDFYVEKTSATTAPDATDQCFMGERFKARIGISILNLSDLNLASKTFYAEVMVWLKYAELPPWLDHWDEEIVECPVKDQQS